MDNHNLIKVTASNSEYQGNINLWIHGLGADIFSTFYSLNSCICIFSSYEHVACMHKFGECTYLKMFFLTGWFVC